ncbi:MAG TPA: S8 family serine peptidase [Drouetiella sp.]|jgi:subtilisin family serine protease
MSTRRASNFVAKAVRAISVSCIVLSATSQTALAQHSLYRNTSDKYADETLIITLCAGADMTRVQQTLDELHITVRRTLPVVSENYTILFVMPEKGTADATLNKILAKKDRNFETVSRNLRLKGAGMKSLSASAPNDPYFIDQWNLATIGWTQARNNFQTQLAQMPQPAIYDLDSGVQPISNGNEPSYPELSNIKQWNALSDAKEPISESAHDDYGHGTGCATVYGAITDNEWGIAGVASFSKVNMPAIYEFRCLNSKDDIVPLTTIVSILQFISNKEISHLGKAPINISLQDGGLPTAPYWSDKTLQRIAHTLYNQGSLVVLCAGDYGQDLSSYQPPSYIRVLQGTDKDNYLGTKAEGDPSDWLGADKPTAPGYEIKGWWSNPAPPLVYDLVGTSFAAPTWAGCIAVLQALDHKLTAPAADKILLETAQTLNSKFNGTATTVKMVNLNAAIQKVLH